MSYRNISQYFAITPMVRLWCARKMPFTLKVSSNPQKYTELVSHTMCRQTHGYCFPTVWYEGSQEEIKVHGGTLTTMSPPSAHTCQRGLGSWEAVATSGGSLFWILPSLWVYNHPCVSRATATGLRALNKQVWEGSIIKQPCLYFPGSPQMDSKRDFHFTV